MTRGRSKARPVGERRRVGGHGSDGPTTPALCLRAADNIERQVPIDVATAEEVLAAVPWRTFRPYRKQKHYSGWYWSTTTGGHVIYESRLELARLLLADFDPDVAAIAAQPFLLVGSGRKPRHHIPDFFLGHRNGTYSVVNVKPEEMLGHPPVASSLAWAEEVIGARGWADEVWTGCAPLVLSNVRFLAGYRRRDMFDPQLLDAAEEAAGSGETIGEIERCLIADGMTDPRPLLLHLVWTARLRVDLALPLGGDTVVARQR